MGIFTKQEVSKSDFCEPGGIKINSLRIIRHHFFFVFLFHEFFDTFTKKTESKYIVLRGIGAKIEILTKKTGS